MKSVTTMRSSTRERTGVMAIGRQSEGESETDTLATGRIEAAFHWPGTTDDDNDMFIMLAIGAAKNGAPISKNHAGMLSNPDAVWRRVSNILNIRLSETKEETSQLFTVSLALGAS